MNMFEQNNLCNFVTKQIRQHMFKAMKTNEEE